MLRKKRRYMTLVEMMIVMFLIAMITGVIAYNYTGSLEEGKAFKTKSGIDKIHTILDLHLAVHPESKQSIDTQWKQIVRDSKLVKSSEELIHDGWGNEYQVTTSDSDDIVITSPRYEAYRANKGSLFTDRK
jgi:Tfp pilus assembly protein PilE